MRKGILVIILGILGGSISILFLFFKKDFISQNNDKTPQNIDYQKNTILKQKITEKERKELLLDRKVNETIIIALPKILYTSGFIYLGQQLKQNNNLTIHFLPINDLEEYYTLIQQGGLINKSDILLIPYERKKNINTDTFQLEENILPYFSPLVYPIINNKFDFFPLGIDPMLMLTQGIDTIQSLKIQDILNVYKLPAPQKSGIYTPLLRFPKEKNEKETQYNIAIKTNLQQQNQQKAISALTKLSQENTTKQLKLLGKKLIEKEASCKGSITACLLKFKFGSILFGFLSEYNNIPILQDSPITLSTFPFYGKKYPVRVRGFIKKDTINKNKDNAIILFLQQFLHQFERENFPIIPAITNEVHYHYLKNEKYKKINTLYPYWKILGETPQE